VVNKQLYWIPVLGIFISLYQFDKENGMSIGWNYYQALSVMVFIALMTIVSR